MKFTLDTNCILAVAEEEPSAPFVRKLADAHATKTHDVAVVAISASENQPDGAKITNFSEFRNRLKALGLVHLGILKPVAYWDVTFWDWSLWAGDRSEVLDQAIHDVLFPNINFKCADYLAANGSDPNAAKKWRNAKCDVLAMWSHIFYERDVFVTTDGNFFKQQKETRLIGLGAKQILTPEEASSLVAVS